MSAPQGQVPEHQIIVTLAAVAAMGSMAIHMLVPALPLIGEEFGIGQARTQQAVSIYLAGLAGGQLLAGPLIDRIGRRPLMQVGLMLFVAGALACALAPSSNILMLARLVQAMGGACCLVTARVMVGDIFGPARAAGVQATLMMIVLLSPAVSPVVGGMIADLGGWRSIFLLLSTAGLLALVFAYRRLPETRMQGGAGDDRPSISASYRRLARNRRFILTSIALGCASSGLFMFLGSAPFLLIGRYGLSSTEAGMALLVVAAASICGTRLVVPIQRRWDAVLIGSCSAVLGALIALALALAGIQGPIPLVGPVMFLGLGAGLAGPAAFNSVAFAEKGLAATATSIAGAGQMLASATSVTLLGLFAPVDPLRLSVALVAATSLSLICSVLRCRS